MEDRYMLSANPLHDWTLADDVGVAATVDTASLALGISPPPPQNQATNQLLGGGAGIGSPYPLEQTFLLHSFPGATKTIYLDFDGFLTRETQWNTDFNLPNILTQAYDRDGDLLTFSDGERLDIQLIWEHVAEDFRPFEVDVTTEDPGVEALRNTSAVDGVDEEWGQRVVIGGSTNDWYTPVDGDAVGGVSYGSFSWDTDTPNFAFAADFFSTANIAEVISHETGHALGLAHDSQFRFYSNIAEDPPETVRLYVEYYPGHGGGSTRWAPIMGVGYGANLTQWSKGEYFNATNDEDGANTLQDDLEIITNRGGTNGNGFDYRADDHGDTTDLATPVILDPTTADLDTSLFTAEGIIEQNTDVDYFSFTVEGLGELVTLDIQPFYNGPNLDILAKLYDSSGSLIATSNPLDELAATFTDEPLLPGTYYVSIEGTGRPITFIDPAFHPGPFEAEGDPPDPELPEDTSDWGYSDYGSLGYYSITGARKKNLVVGVDFDTAEGTSPQNWTLFSSGGPQNTLSNLVSELGVATPYDLTISTSGTGFDGLSSTINGGQVPDHALPLDGLDGHISTADESWNFVWSGLQPSEVYQVYVFGNSATAAVNNITVAGGEWNGVVQTYSFTQTISPNDLLVNDNAPSSDSLSTLTLFVIADEFGKITIHVSAGDGSMAGLAGLAIATTKVGSLAGQKWNDQNGDGTKDPGEGGLENWIIYLDLNNDGILNSTNDLEVTQPSPDVPQQLVDNTIKKSELFFAEVGEIIDVDVTLDIQHTFDGDLDVYLISPSGTRVKLFSDIGGTEDNFTNTILDDEAPTAINTASAPFTGRFRPEASISASEQSLYPNAQTTLSAFDGENSSGIWRLEITDDANGDTGQLLGWSLTIKLAGVFLEPYTVTDASGNYAFTDLPPGLYYVREQIQEDQILEGWKASWTPPPVTVRSGANLTDIDFGNWIPVSLPGSISGQKWNDLDGDGVKDDGEPGLPGWTIFIDADNDGEVDIGTETTIVSTDVPKAITDFSNVQSQVSYSGLGSVAKVTVTVDISHSFAADLDVFLVSPSGTSIELFTGVGGQYNDFVNLTLDDEADRSIANIGINDQPYTGTWRPEGYLSDLIGEDADGNWTLVVRDTAFADTGTLNSWSLAITVGELYTETDENGNYAFESLPPGTYLIREELRPGWEQTYPTEDGSWEVAIGGGNVSDRDFGNHQMQQLVGDFDESGTVDLADYVFWRKENGTDVEPFTGADANGDGHVDETDRMLWRAHFGDTLTPPGAGAAGGAVVEVDATQNEVPASPAQQPQSVLAAMPSGENDTGEVRLALERDVVTATNVASPSSVSVDVPTATFKRTAPRPRNAFAAAPTVRSADSNDAAILAWLSTGSRGYRPTASNGFDSPASKAKPGSDDSTLSDSVDVVFEAIGAA